MSDTETEELTEKLDAAEVPGGETIAPSPDAPEGQGVPAAPPAAPVIPPGYVPITALMDERDKRQAREREADELRRYREDQEAKAKAAPPPDFFEKPDERLAYERQTLQHALWNERLNMSEMLARQAHGDDVVAAAQESFAAAARKNPGLHMELRSQANPYGFVVQWHKRQEFLTDVGSDPDAWRAKERERLRAEIAAETQQQVPPRQVVPGSLARAPSAGPGEPRASGMDLMFPRK